MLKSPHTSTPSCKQLGQVSTLIYTYKRKKETSHTSYLKTSWAFKLVDPLFDPHTSSPGSHSKSVSGSVGITSNTAVLASDVSAVGQPCLVRLRCVCNCARPGILIVATLSSCQSRNMARQQCRDIIIIAHMLMGTHPGRARSACGRGASVRVSTLTF